MKTRMAAALIFSGVASSAFAAELHLLGDQCVSYARGNPAEAPIFKMAPNYTLGALSQTRAPWLGGTLYYNGYTVPQDYVEAAKWFQKGAEIGDHRSQFSFAVMLWKGEGVRRDAVEAHKWMNLAAVSATTNYGLPTTLGLQLATKCRDNMALQMTPAQIAEAHRLAAAWKPK